jgi:signal transduction histidine kinase/CheY-like chemotaxis protein
MTSIHEPEPGSRQADPLARRNDELELVLAASRLGFCVLEGETVQVRANSQFKSEFGWAPDARIDWQGLQTRMAPESRVMLNDAVRAAFSSGADFDLIVQAQWPDGATQWVALKGRTSNDGNNNRTLILTSRNVTGEREAKEQFLYLFSHELRSPLNAILGWNRILALKRPEDTEVAAITARIEQSARAQLKMVNDLLDLGRIETGKLHVEPRPMQLGKVVSAAVDLARPTAAMKDITLHADLEAGAGQLRGDPDRLQQVVTNLLSNALKFTGSGGRITLTLRDRGELAELRVADTGQGIAPELLPHVFDRFRQADSSATRHAGGVGHCGGLGLGLALVREIVSLHGGHVSAHSAGVGQGAEFLVRLPTRRPGKLASGTSLGGLSILVVDDESDARAVIAETLKLEGADVTVTDSAASAFETLQQAGTRFDIIVTDIGMPEVDGYSLVRRLRALQSGRRLLAIAVTGYASSTDVEAAMDAGFDLHVSKPVDFNTFVPLVRRLVTGKKGAGWSHHSPPNGGSSASATAP